LKEINIYFYLAKDALNRLKSDSKDIYEVTKRFLFEINAALLIKQMQPW